MNDQLCFYVHQKGFKLKEDIRVFRDEQMTREVLSIQARKVMDFSGAYDVIDSATGQRIGVLKRRGLKSIAQDTWDVCDANDAPFALIQEDHLIVALLRRFFNFIPQNYDMLIGGQRVMDLAQNFNPFTYHLVMDFTWDKQNQVDRRLGIAAGILLAAIEGRQRG